MGYNLSAQIVIDQSLTPEEIVETVLLGSGVAVSNITFNGQPGDVMNTQIGSFSGTSEVVDFPAGVVLATTNVDGAIGGPGFGMTNPVSGDPDLVAISGQNSNDGAILEFDFVPNGDSLEFRYVFASNEYPGYTCTGFNDAFGFFISGPGFNGPFSLNAENIALIPDTDIPVAINTINGGAPTGGGTVANCLAANPNFVEDSQYFVNNQPPADGDITVPGLTVTLTAYANVICGETYHIKIAIGDAADGALDSFVFLEAESFNSNSAVQVNLEIPIGVNDSTLYEGCGQAKLQFIRPLTSTGVMETAYLDITGTAINGIDFIPQLPDSIVFPAGVDTVTFVMTAPADGIVEGQETIHVVITNIASGCAGQEVTSEFTFYINEADPLQISGFDDALVDCHDEVELYPTITGGYGQYIYSWSNGATEDTVTVSPGFSTNYFLVVADTCGAGSQQTNFMVDVPVYPIVQVEIGEDIIVNECDVTVSIVPEVTGGFGAYTYVWTDYTGEVVGENEVLEYLVASSTPIELTVYDDCQAIGTDELDIILPPVEVTAFVPDIFTATSCLESFWIPAVSEGGIGEKTYTWYVDGALQEETANVIFEYHPSMGQLVVMVAEDECENTATDSTFVEFNFPELTIATIPDTAICSNTEAILWTEVLTGSGGYNYHWSSINKRDDMVLVSPRQTTAYPLTVTDTCGAEVSVNVKVEVRNVFADFEWDYLDYYGLQLRNRSQAMDPTYAWDFGDGGNSTEANPRYFYTGYDPYKVTLVTTDDIGCIDSTSRMTIPPLEIYIPSAFTPNGDGFNELFEIFGPDVTEFQMWIYDRWGALVFQTDDLDKKWNGSHMGGDYHSGTATYNYFIKYKGEKEEDAYEKTGTITVIR